MQDELADVVFSSSPTNANIDFVSNFYGLDSELLRSEKQIFENYDTDDPYDRNNASTIVKTMYQKYRMVFEKFYQLCT